MLPLSQYKNKGVNLSVVLRDMSANVFISYENEPAIIFQPLIQNNEFLNSIENL